jgi:hypothetical protein
MLPSDVARHWATVANSQRVLLSSPAVRQMGHTLISLVSLRAPERWRVMREAQ